MAPLADRPGRTASRPEPSKARPVIAVPAPWSAGTVTRVHVDPPSVLSQTPEYVVPAPLTWPEITVSGPREVM